MSNASISTLDGRELVLYDQLSKETNTLPKNINIIMQCTEAFVTLATVNFDKLVNFYTQLLQQNPTTLIPHIYAEFQLPGMRLGIFCPQKNHESEFQSSTKSKMSLCLEVSNLEAAIAHLCTLGYPPSENIAIASHGREIYAYDPDGNRLILHQQTRLINRVST